MRVSIRVHTLRTLLRAARTLVTVAAVTAVPAAAQQDTAVTAPSGAPVVFRGDTLFHLTGTLGPFTPEERAAALVERIRRLADDPLARAADVVVVDSAGVTDIRLHDVVVMSVTERDAVEAAVGRQALAEQWGAMITSAIRSREGSATLQSILIGVLFTILTTAGVVFAFKFMNRAFPWIYRLLESWRGTRLPSIRIQRLEVLSSARLTDGLLLAAKVVRVVAVVFLLYIYIPLVLSFFPWTRDLSTQIFDWVLDPLGRTWQSFVAYLPSAFTVAVIVAVVWYVLKFVHLVFLGLRRGAITVPGFYRDWADPTYKIVRFLIVAFAAVVVWPYLPGSGTDAFKGISVFLGVVFTFSSSSAIANVVAGVVMTYMRPFQIGDRVKIADTVGDIVEKTLLVTRVRTIKRVDVTIPNAMVLSSHIINYSATAKEGGVILHTGVTIGYDAPWRKVRELLLAAADGTEGVLGDPKPFVLQTGLDDFYVRYELNAYTDDPNRMARIYSDLHQNIQDRFNEAGVEITSPHYGALRDGSQTAIPADYLPPGYEAPAFRVQGIGETLGRAIGRPTQGEPPEPTRGPGPAGQSGTTAP